MVQFDPDQDNFFWLDQCSAFWFGPWSREAFTLVMWVHTKKSNNAGVEGRFVVISRGHVLQVMLCGSHQGSWAGGSWQTRYDPRRAAHCRRWCSSAPPAGSANTGWRSLRQTRCFLPCWPQKRSHPGPSGGKNGDRKMNKENEGMVGYKRRWRDKMKAKRRKWKYKNRGTFW